MKKIILAIAALALAAGLHAQGLPSLLIPTDTRSLAMGGVNLRPEAEHMDASAFFGIWAPMAAKNTMFGADVWFKIGDRLALTADVSDFMDRPYEISNDAGSVRSTFQPSDFIFGFGAEYFITDAILAGIRLRNVTSSLADNAHGNSFGGDVYFRFEQPVWSVGLAGRNIGTPVNYGFGANPIPLYVALDGKVKPIKGLTVAAEADYLLSGAVMAGVGAEYGILDIAFVRAGFHYGDGQKALPTFLSLGLGARFAGIKIDAGMLLLSKTLGNSFLVSAGYEF